MPSLFILLSIPKTSFVYYNYTAAPSCKFIYPQGNDLFNCDISYIYILLQCTKWSLGFWGCASKHKAVALNGWYYNKGLKNCKVKIDKKACNVYALPHSHHACQI